MFPTQREPERGRLSGKKYTGEALSMNFNSDNINPALVFDGSGNQFHGTVSGATHVPAGGINGGGVYDFDGVDDYIELNDGMTIKSYLVGATELNLSGIYVRDNNIDVYVVGFNQDTVRRYLMATPGDISTASLHSSFGIAGQEADANGLFFSSDGTKMFVGGDAGDDITYYTLSTAWDITTSVHGGQFSIAGLETSIRGFTFKTDGTKLYVIGVINDTVYQYSLSTAWDLTTATYDTISKVIAEDTEPQEIRFNDDGTKMYILGATGDDINVYDLGTAWNVSTATVTGITFYVGTQDITPRGMHFSSDGMKLYLAGDTNNTIYQYNLYSPYSFSNPIYSGGFTIMADIKADSIGAVGGRIFDKTFANNGALSGIHLYMGANILRTAINGGALVDSGASAITYGTKYRIAVTYSQSGLVSFYINGASNGTPASTNPPSQITTATNSRIGNRALATDRTFDGYIGNVRIYSRVLTTAEILADYTALGDARDFTGIPRLTTTMRDAIVSPANGYVIFNITTATLQTWNGAAWV